MGGETAFRADTAFAKPEIHEAAQAQGRKYAIRIPATNSLEGDIPEPLNRRRFRVLPDRIALLPVPAG